jgi:hypothetical protein
MDDMSVREKVHFAAQFVGPAWLESTELAAWIPLMERLRDPLYPLWELPCRFMH